MQLIDITVPLGAGLPVYPGNPPFSLEPIKRISQGGSSNVSSVRMGSHTGTHVDAPRHYFDGGAGVDQLALELLIGPARVVEIQPLQHITEDDLEPFQLGGHDRILFKTSNSTLWDSSEFHQSYVGIAESGARHLVEKAVKVVGIDYLSVEGFRTPGAPAHHVLLEAGTIVIEGLNLRDVSPGVYEMFCLPLRIVGADGAPARVVLRRS